MTVYSIEPHNNERLYKTLVNDVLAGTWNWDIKANYLYVSPSLKAMIGYGEDELVEFATWRDIMHPDDIAIVDEALKAHFNSKGEIAYSPDVRYYHKNGSIVWVTCTGRVIEWGENGQPLRMVGVHIDITKYKVIEQKLKKTKDLLNKTNLSVSLGGWEFDVANNKLAWTRVTKQIHEVPFNYEPSVDDALGFYKEGLGREALRKGVEGAMATGKSYDTEALLITTTGREVWVRTIGNAEFEDGKCVRLFGTLQNIDEEMKIKLELQSSEARFKGAFENSTIGMALVSPEGKWLKVNQNLISCLGYTEDELNQITFQDITHPEDLEKDLDLLNKLIKGEVHHYQMEKRYFHKNGSVIWALLSVSLVRDERGNPLHFVSQIQDITDKKLQEEQIKATLDVVNHQNERLLNFAYIVSHNLRTHSGNFQSLIDMVNDPETEPDEKTHLLKLLQNVSTQLSDTIVNLNDVVSIQTSNLKKASINLNSYIERTIDVVAGDVSKHRVIIKNNVDPAAEVLYHPAYLESILLNFVTNSIRYRHPERQPEIIINLTDTVGGRVLTVADNGLGIDLARHGKNLFGMYKTFHGNKEARGVGLFITKSQVEAMGGKIDVESKVDEGTTFRVFVS
ncbi:hypothetical protein GCM10023149_11760 [Mucilaginibacter gynuensis]|uniref:histidine kinase n=1 Tax=Mucilaginibacter gynuensis TaxID=1302236 RepID=A0ABP8G1U1_9SPHI